MGLWSIISSARHKGNECPYCHKPLIPAETNGQDGLAEEEMWQTVYTTFFIPVRRTRFVCLNPKCKYYFRTTHHKFVRNLLGDRWVSEHFLSDAIDSPYRKKVPEEKSNRAASKREAAEAMQDEPQEQMSGRFVGQNPLASYQDDDDDE